MNDKEPGNEACRLIHCRCGACGVAIHEDGGCGCEDNRRHGIAVHQADRITKMTDTVGRLQATNQRLHRRCQRAESLAAKWRRRYAAAAVPLAAAHAVAVRLVSQLKTMNDEQRRWVEKPWRYCWWCRIRRQVKARLQRRRS